MTSMLRLLAALLLALCFALPSLGGEGGDNAGGTGVWVLPRASFLTPPGPVARDLCTRPIASDIVLEMSSEMGLATATLVDAVTGVPVSLAVNGLRVTIPCSLLQAIAASSSPTASLVIADAAQLGYAITITIDASGIATLRVQ